MDLNRKLQLAWGNLIWHFGENTAFGIEYQYGQRKVDSGISGDNHRILFVATLATGGKSQIPTSAAGQPQMQSLGSAPAAAPVLPNLPVPDRPAFRRRL